MRSFLQPVASLVSSLTLVFLTGCGPSGAPATAPSGSAEDSSGYYEPPPPLAKGVPAKKTAPAKKTPAAQKPSDLAKRYEGKPALTTLTGEASYYADSLAGNATASGTPYRPEKHSAAHRKLPFGTVVRVVRPDTGAVTYAVVNDRGPFGKKTRIIDLSRAAANDLDMIRAGVVKVRVEVVERPK